MKVFSTKIWNWAAVVAWMCLTSLVFSNCGQVEFGTSNVKPSGTFIVDPGNTGQGGVPDMGAGNDGADGDFNNGTDGGLNNDGGPILPPPPGHSEGDNCRGGHNHNEHHDNDGCPKDEDGEEHHRDDHDDDGDDDHDKKHKDDDDHGKCHHRCGNDHDDDGDDDHDKKHKDDDDDLDEDGHKWYNHHHCQKSCGNNGIKDIVVNIDYIEIRGTHGEVIKIDGDLGETSLIQGSLPVALAKDIEIVSISLVLAHDGNYLIDNDNKQFNLKIPTGHFLSRLKIPLSGVVSVKAGSYKIDFKINPNTQFFRSGEKCIFQPVLKFISLTPIQTF